MVYVLPLVFISLDVLLVYFCLEEQMALCVNVLTINSVSFRISCSIHCQRCIPFGVLIINT